MEVTAGTGPRGGFSITHMLHSIIPSFVRRTKAARGAGFKKETQSLLASRPGHTPAKPEDRSSAAFSRMLYTLAGGGTLCGVAALVLLIVSTATDFWMQYRYSGSSANQGLWRFCINHKCHAHTITVAFWDATRAFMLLAVLSCFAGVVLGLSAFTNGTKNRRVRTGGIALVLSGFLALLALAIYTGVTVTFFGKRFLDWRFSWSYIIGWVAVILAFAAGVFQLCAYQRTNAEPAPSNNPDS
ncbi:lens intrinsic membrane protein 2.2 isoform X2 [Betta splendens]|uniref:Lens intrinsic membrane protein 2.2 isoform X2 n=1 Tax=Betta splendens TaxID=158456 RepID=A0A9W2XR80_BETSP|nr:lens intrinsic membrane protein 2.2 isoform X2 [Betta splendens]